MAEKMSRQHSSGVKENVDRMLENSRNKTLIDAANHSRENGRLTNENIELKRRVMALEEQNSALKKKLNEFKVHALEDNLTGLGNRRKFDKDIVALVAEYKRFMREENHTPQHNFTVVFVDLDGLKKKNDEEGHAAGDRYIKDAVGKINEVVREADSVYRIGGDEFVMLLRGADKVIAGGEEKSVAKHIAERLAKEDMSVGFSNFLGLKTVMTDKGTAGLALNNETQEVLSRGDPLSARTAEIAHALVDIADKRMYKNKQERRLAQVHRKE